MLQIERVDAHGAVEHLRAAHELREDNEPFSHRLLRRLAQHVLKREQVEAITHRAIEVHVAHAEEREAVVDGP